MTNADLTLINLNLLYVKYFDLVDKELHVPLGCLYLTRALEDAGFSVDFRDYQRNTYDEPFEMENMLDFVRDPAPIIGFSCMANLLPFVLLSMREVKARYPDRFLILGGVGAKSVEEQIMERFPWIDAIAVGEGEGTLPALIGAIKGKADLSSVPGLVVRTPAGSIVRTPSRPRFIDLDAIPFPAFEKIDLTVYRGYGLMSSRGCPYPCTFCSVAPVWDRVSTYRSNANILAEMRHLHETAGVELFLFQDEFFVCNKPKVMEFCAEIKKSGPRVYWKAFGRVDLTDHEMMTAMADAGCVELRFGIESGSDRVLDLVKKGFTTEQALATVAEAVKVFPRVDAFYMWGFPFETIDDFHQTVFQMLTLRMMGARILPSLLCLLPQTDLYRDERTNYPLDFCPDLFPEYMITGHEVSTMARFHIEPRHQAKYEFIQAHPDLFPGFFHFDLERNVRPKLAILKKFGFYPEDRDTPDTESCGAHSPKISAAPRGLANLAARLDA